MAPHSESSNGMRFLKHTLNAIGTVAISGCILRISRLLKIMGLHGAICHFCCWFVFSYHSIVEFVVIIMCLIVVVFLIVIIIAFVILILCIDAMLIVSY